MGLFRSRRPRPPKKTVVADVHYPATNGHGTSVFEVESSARGLGVIYYGEKPAFLYPGGKLTRTDGNVDKIAASTWRPYQGWTDLELIAAGFPPPPRPERSAVEQLAVAVLSGDRSAWAPLIDAALEEVARAG
jgi:hypothetical protein